MKHLPVERVVEGLRCGRPLPARLVRHDDPDGSLAEGDAHKVEKHSNDDAILDLVDDAGDRGVAVLPLHINKPREDAHHVGRGPDPWLVVEFIHEIRLRGKVGIVDGVAPVVDHDLDEGGED